MWGSWIAYELSLPQGSRNDYSADDYSLDGLSGHTYQCQPVDDFGAVCGFIRCIGLYHRLKLQEIFVGGGTQAVDSIIKTTTLIRYTTHHASVKMLYPLLNKSV